MQPSYLWYHCYTLSSIPSCQWSHTYTHKNNNHQQTKNQTKHNHKNGQTSRAVCGGRDESTEFVLSATKAAQFDFVRTLFYHTTTALVFHTIYPVNLYFFNFSQLHVPSLGSVCGFGPNLDPSSADKVRESLRPDKQAPVNPHSIALVQWCACVHSSLHVLFSQSRMQVLGSCQITTNSSRPQTTLG
jgi:hypothetical protein